MIVDNDGIINYLLSRNLISADRIVDSDLALIDVSRRNSNFKVISRNSPSYFLKQEIRNRSDRTTDAIDIASVAYEAGIYDLLQHHQTEKAFCRYLPQFYEYDPQEQILILEGIEAAITLTDYHLRHARFSITVARHLGKALATLHSLSVRGRSEADKLLSISHKPPWIFFLTCPDQWVYFNSSSANMEFVRIMQQSAELCTAFEDLRRKWKPAALIHGDLKWDNCLVPANSSPAGIRIIDWELACMGDPIWDVACVLGEYLKCWISSIPVSADAPPDEFLELAAFPITKMRPAMSGFWNAYTKQMKMPPREQPLPLLSRFTAVRLVQVAFEQLQTEAAATAGSICLLQLSLNMIARPVEAAVQLLGLPFPEKYYQEELMP